MLVEENQIVLSDDSSSPARLFLPFISYSQELLCPLATADVVRLIDGRRVTLELYKNRIISVWEEEQEYLMLKYQISFGYQQATKKLWFTNNQTQIRQNYQSENKKEFQQFVEQLKNKCPQQNFLNIYQLLEKTGKGSKAQVYIVRRKSDKAIFAAKIQKYNTSFKRQVQILQQLQHPNLVYLRQYFIQPDNNVYIVMDFQDGGSLLDMIQNNSLITGKQKLKIFTDMLNALEYLRLKGIVHRDLKPENILYSKKKKIYKLADFGMSRKQGQKLDGISGTPGYMAPETLNTEIGILEADIRSDIYSMGLVFYEILTYKQYYGGNNPQQIIRKNKYSISLKKKQINSSQIDSLQYTLLEKMIRSNPQNRKSSLQILKSSTFSKLNKIHGLQYLSSTSPSKKIDSEKQKPQKEIDDGFVGSFWKLLRMKSWSS